MRCKPKDGKEHNIQIEGFSMNTKNIILNTDSYKSSHYLQYPPKSEYVSSYIEARGGEVDASLFFQLSFIGWLLV